MTLKELFDNFYNKWNGKVADYDGYYGGQCYDLAQFWAKEVGGHTFVGLYAKDIYSQPGSFYEQISNTPDAIPQVGDIVVWNGNYNGGPGHVGVANGKGDLDTFDCFEQNDPTGSICHIKTYSYNNVIGWLRPKYDEVSPQPTDDCQTKLAEKTALETELRGVIQKKDAEIAELKAKDANFEAIVSEKNALAVQLDACQRSSNTYKEAYDALPTLKEQIAHLEDMKKLQAEEITKLQTRNSYLETKYANVKKPIQKLIIAMAEKLGVQL